MYFYAKKVVFGHRLKYDLRPEDVNTVFAYEGANVTFARKGGVVVVNATEMAKPFGKSCSDWLRTEQSKRMINAISTSKKCDVADLVRVTNGGNTGNGTWMHEDVAIVFVDSPKVGEVQIFDNPQFGQIRTAGTADAPLFCLADVCRVLELRVDGVTPRLKKDGYNRIGVIDSLGRHQEAIFVNEQNLYKVIMRSDKPQAEPFQDWVCGEVLPSIRKTGSYSIKNLSRKELALMVIQAEEENERLALENKRQATVIEEQKPKVVFADAIVGSQSSCLIGELAKIITQNGYKIGQNLVTRAKSRHPRQDGLTYTTSIDKATNTITIEVVRPEDVNRKNK